MRREKKETDLKLPPKKEIIIYAPLTDVQQKLYRATLDKQLEILLKKDEVIRFYKLLYVLYFARYKYKVPFIKYYYMLTTNNQQIYLTSK